MPAVRAIVSTHKRLTIAVRFITDLLAVNGCVVEFDLVG
jgi:hypothetical protein